MPVRKDPPEHLETRSLAPAVGFTAAGVEAGALQGQADETGEDVAGHDELDRSLHGGTPFN